MSSILKVRDSATGEWINIPAIVGPAGKDGATGPAGVAGENGKDGYTPVKGVDYYTDAEKVEFEKLIADEMAKRGQVKPEFANSIDECVDTSKLYVLPDGNIYAYIYTSTTVETGENILPTLAPITGLTKTESGLYYGVYASTSGGTAADTNCTTTGLIPCTSDNRPTLYIKGVYWDSSSSHSRIMIVQKTGTFQSTHNLSTLKSDGSTAFTLTELATNYYRLDVNDRAFKNVEGTAINTGYIALSFDNTTGNEDIVVSLEPIGASVKEDYAWADTGHTFVPADYEDRIVKLENDSDDLQGRVNTLESVVISDDNIPQYIKDEAERVADLVLENRTSQSIVFAGLSDFHYPYDDASDGNATTAQSITHAGLGIAEMRKYVSFDFMGLFGDYVRGAGNSTVAESKDAIKFIHKSLYEAGVGLQQIWLQGNHDRNPYDTDDGDLTDEELYSYIFSNNKGTVVDADNVQRGYGYKDFEAQKIRVIYFNSSDISGAEEPTDHMFSTAQLTWMANTAFNMSKKNNPSEWGIIVLSHMPFNWSSTPLNLVDGYISGTKGTTGNNVSFDFTTGERAEVICLINGHTHNFRASQIGTHNTWQIAIPQMCAGRYNEYGTSWPEVGGEVDENGQPVYYRKEANSAKSTSFCVFVVDRKTRKIRAYHYGAGIDRELNY
jgi:hypothetical protein